MTQVLGGGSDRPVPRRADGPDPGSEPVTGQIRQADFPKVRRGGYDPEQVNAYLSKLADWVDRLRSELATTRSRLAKAEEELQAIGQEPESNQYDQLGQRMADLLRVADEQAEKIRVEAQGIADQEIERAREQARKLLGDAEAEAAIGRDQDRLARTSIHQEANALLAAGDRLRANLESMRRRLAPFTDGPVEPLERGETVPHAPSVDLTREGRDDASSDAAQPNDELRRLFSDPETVVRLEGLGDELFADDEG